MDTGEPVNMVHAYSALTQDIITEYCFSDCRNVIEMEKFSPLYYDLVQKPSELSHTCVLLLLEHLLISCSLFSG